MTKGWSSIRGFQRDCGKEVCRAAQFGGARAARGDDPQRQAPGTTADQFERFEWHYTPKHGSWLNMAECELSVLSTQCLDRRIADKQTLTTEVAAWQARRNNKHAKADWQFTTANARTKLKRHYPAL
jgi:uncharacterized small protein (DUF1192 family)